MTLDEYICALGSSEHVRLPKRHLIKFATFTYPRANALLFKCSPWAKFRKFISKPFNKLFTKIADWLPAEALENDDILQLTVYMKLVGYWPYYKMGWKVVDAIPLTEISVEKFKEYFETQCKATLGLSRATAKQFVQECYDKYIEKTA